MSLIVDRRTTMPAPDVESVEEDPAPTLATPAATCGSSCRWRLWGLGLLAAEVAVVVGSVLVEPEPAAAGSPGLLLGLLVVAAALSVIAGGLGTMAGAVAGASWVGVPAMTAAVGMTAMAVTCPLSGHHSGFGAWWVAQMAMSLAMVALSAAALRAARTAGKPPAGAMGV